MDVGGMLRNARERQGVSVEALADRTKIRARVLRAIELNDLSALPRGIFVRGFLRAYAREVGLDPEVTVHDYFAQFEPAPVPETTDEPAADDPIVVAGYAPFDPLQEPRSGAGAAIALAVGALALVGFFSMRPPADPADQPLPIAEATGMIGQIEIQPTADLASAGAGAPVATSGEGLTIEISPHGACWVEARADGDVQIYRLMDFGERQTLAVRDDLVLRVGDPATFGFTINGRPARLPGHAGEPVTVVINSENFTQFLAG